MTNKIKYLFYIMLFLLLPLNLSSKEFLNSFLHINFTFSYGFSTFGDILDVESNSYYLTETYADGDTKKVYPGHDEKSYGGTLDIVPFSPIVLAADSHAIKFGARMGYKFHFLDQSITLNNSGEEEKEYKESLMTFKTIMIGPVIHYSPSIEADGIDGEYTSAGGFTFFVLFGKILNGKLTAFPARRLEDDSITNYKSAFSGYKYDIGFGSSFAVCSINLGINLYYSRLNIVTDNQIYLTANPNSSKSISKETSINEFSIEFFMGIPVDFI